MNEPFKNVYQENIEGKQRFLNDIVGKDDKRRMLNWVKPGNILEVGSGSGVILDMLEDAFPDSTIIGMDLSEKVVKSLELKKQHEDRRWHIYQGDATNLPFYVEDGTMDTIIFCSVLHEVFSYTSFRGNRFSHWTVDSVIQDAFAALKPGGRIIIRDGIMSEPEDKWVILKFATPADSDDVIKFQEHFEGRRIRFHRMDPITISMPINDAMEFLYTITWGPEAFDYEVQEQYGYYTKSRWLNVISELFGDDAEFVVFDSYLQPGYKNNLKGKVTLLDEKGQEIEFPDSNCLIVIQKKKGSRGNE